MSDDTTAAIPLDEWIERLRRALGTSEPGIELGPDEREALLDLTRVAAHRSEANAAALTAFLVGAAIGDMAQEQRVERIRVLTEALG